MKGVAGMSSKPEKNQEQLQIELEQTRQRLAESEEKLLRLSYENEFRKQMLDTFNAPVMVLDRDLKVLHANQAAANLARLPLSSFLGISLFGVFPPNMADNIQTRNLQVFQTGEALLGIEESMDMRGSRRWLRMDRYPFYDTNGDLSAVLLVSEDITERKLSDQAIRDSERRYQELTDSLPEAMFETDLSGHITYVNKSGLELMGYNQQDFDQGLLLFQMLIPEDLERLKQNWLMLLQGKDMENHQYTAQRKDGFRFPVLAYSRLKVKDGQPVGLIGFVVDISDRKAAEEAILASQAKLTEAQAIAAMAYWEFDIATGMFTFNDDYYRNILHTTAEQMGGYQVSAPQFASLVHPEDAQSVPTEIQKAIVSPDPNYLSILDARINCPDGIQRNIQVRIRVIKDETGQTVKLYGINQDITEQKRIEAQSAARAADLATVAEVSTAISTILDPQQMLQTVVDLTKERFHLYHSHIYLLDETGEQLLLTSGAGQIGQQMVKEKRSIPLSAEKSIVARTARSRSGNIVNDVLADPEFLPHPLLPQTRSEMAVPIVVGETLLGVLDVQAEQAEHFTEDDNNVLSTLGSQIAVALQNARQYSQLQQSEQLTRSIIDSTPDWIFIRDRQHRYQMVNASYAQDMHLPAEEILGKTDRDLGLPEELLLGNAATGRIGFWQQDDRIIDTGLSQTFPSEIIEMDGETRIFNMIKTPLRNEEGEITGVLAFGRDVTERESLFEQNQRLYEAGRRISTTNNIQEMISGMMYGIDIPDVNRTVVFLFEYDAEGEVKTLEVGGNWHSGEGHQPTPLGIRFGIHDLNPAAVRQMVTDQPIFLNETDQLTQQRHILSMAVVPLITSGQQIGSVLLETERFHTFSENEIRPVLSMSQQLATAIQTQRLLIQAQTLETRYRILLQAVPDMIFRLNAQDVFIDFKPGRAQAYLPPELFLGKHYTEILPPFVTSIMGEAMRLCRETGQPQVAEYELPYPDGRPGYYELNIVSGEESQVIAVVRDITQDRLSQQALERNQEQLNQALEIAQMGYWEFDFAAQTFTLSEQYLKLLGMNTDGSTTYPVNEFSSQFVHPEDIELVFAEIQKAVASTDPGYAGEQEVRLKHTNGQYRTTLARFTIQRDEMGHPLKASGSSQDITQRKAAEQELARLGLMVEQSTEGMSISDMQGNILFVNKAFAAMHGYAVEEMVGRSLAEFTTPDMLAGPIATLQQLIMEKGAGQVEILDVRRDGTRFPAIQFVTLLQDARQTPIGLSVIAQDITDRKATEQAIRDSETRFRSLVANIAGAIYRCAYDANYTMLYLSDAIESLSGYPASEFINNQNRSYASIIHPEDTALVDETINRAIELDETYTIEYRILNADGKERWVFEKGRSIKNEKGEVIYLDGSIFDITDRKAAEEIILTSQAKLTEAQTIAAMAYWEFDIATGMFTFNDDYYRNILHTTAEQMGGYQVSAPQFASLVHPEDAPTVPVEIQKAIVSPDPNYLSILDARINCPDGIQRNIQVRIRVIKDETGQTVKLYGINQDITEQKRAQAQIASRAAELATVAQVATTTATILDPQELLHEVVNLTKQRFNLYHAHIYLLDEAGENLVLAVGAGEAGRQMVAQGWQIPLSRERSLVARTARERHGALVNDVRAEPDFLANPLLPDTAAELAVPLITSGRVLGVLDVQSEHLGRFSEEDVNILTILGAQVAVALDNARRYTQLRQSEQLTRTIIDATPDWIFIKDIQHRYRLANRGYASDLHIAPEAFIGKDDLELGFPEELVRGNPEKGIRGFWADDRLVFESGEAQIYPNDPVVIDGEPHVFNTLKTPLRDEQGNIWGVLAFARDVTEREQLFQQSGRLYEAGRRLVTAGSYQDLIEAVMYGVNIPAVNRAVLMLLTQEEGDYTGLEVVANWYSGTGHKPTPLNARIARSDMGETFETLLRTEPVFINETDENTRKQGITSMAILPLWSSERQIGVLLFETEEPHTFTEEQIRPAVSVSQQLAVALQNRILVQELSQAFAEAQRNQVFLRTLLDNIPNPVFFKDPQGRYIGFNKSFLAYIGLTEEQLLGKSVFDLQTDRTLAEKYHQMDVVLFENPGTQIYESRVKYADGSFHDVIFNKATYFNPDGSLAGLVGVIVDITDRKQAEQALLNSQAQLTQALEIAQMGYWEFDFAAQTFTLSEQYLKLLGMNTDGSTTYPVNEFSSQFVHPEDIELVFAEIQKAVASTDPGYAGEQEVRLKHTNGQYRTTLARFTIQRDEMGHPLKASGSSQDITQRKAAEQELARLGLMVEQSTEGMSISDLQGVLIFVNQAFASMHGYTVEEMIGHSLAEFTTPDMLIGPIAQLQQIVMEKGSGQAEILDVHRNGNRFPVIQFVNLLRDARGAPIGLSVLSQDISDRKAAEEAVRQSEARFRTLLQAVPDMIFRLNAQDVFIDFKPGRAQAYLPPEFFLGKHYTEVLPPFVTSIMGSAMQSCRQTGEPQAAEYELPYPDGRPGYYELNVVAGEQEQIIAVVRDITQTKLDAQAIAARAVELATVSEVSTAVSTILDPEQMLQTVVDLTKQRFDFYHAHIYLLDPATNTLRLNVGAGEIGQQMVGEQRSIPFSAERSLVARTARERIGLIVNDVHADPDFLAHPLLPETAAEMTAPILIGEQVLGVLDVQSTQVGRFSQENANVLTTLAAQIGVALQNARQFANTQALYQASQRISSAISSDEMLSAIVEAFDIPALTESGAAFILQLQKDPATGETESAKAISNWHGRNSLPTVPVGAVFPKTMFSALSLMLSPSPIFFNDALNDERIDPASKGILQQTNAVSLAVLPLWIGNEQIGGVIIQTSEQHNFTEEQIRSYPVLASQLAVALQTRLLLDELQTSQQQLTQALQIARLAYWQFDVNQGIFTFNDDYYANILHTTAEEMGGYSIPVPQFAALVHPEDQADVPIQIQKALESTDPNYTSVFESRLICPDGIERVIQARIRILKDAEGRTNTLYGINQDVTERVVAERQIARQATQLATVARVSNTIAAILDPEQMLQTVVELTKSRFGLYHVHIYLMEKDNLTLQLRAGAGEIGKQLLVEKHALNIAAEVSLVARCARTQQPVVVNDVSQSPDYLAHPLLPNTQSEMVIPLLIGNQLLGVMDVQSDQLNAFSESDANILSTLASQVAVSLQNARSFARIQNQAEREALLNNISQQIQSTTTVEAALQVAIREIGRAVGAKRTSVLLDLPNQPVASEDEPRNA